MTNKAKDLRTELCFLFSYLIFFDCLPLSSVEEVIANLVCSAVVGFIVANATTNILIAYKKWWKE